MSHVAKWGLIQLAWVAVLWRPGLAASQADILQFLDPSVAGSYCRPGGAFTLLVVRGKGDLEGLDRSPREFSAFSPALPCALTRSLAAGGPAPAPFSEAPEVLEWSTFEVRRFPLEEEESWRRYNPLTETRIVLELTRWSPEGFHARLECRVKGKRLANLELAGSLEAGAARVFRQKNRAVLVALLPTHILPPLQLSTSPEASGVHEIEASELLPTRQTPRLPARLARKLGGGTPPEVAKLVAVVTRKGEIHVEGACFFQCPHVDLGREILKTLQRWRFRPARLAGIPRNALVWLDYEFMVQ